MLENYNKAMNFAEMIDEIIESCKIIIDRTNKDNFVWYIT